jgi:hypothetical protein
MIRIMYRPAEVVEGGWQPVGEARTLDDIRDEIDSWQGPRLGHGDLVAFGTKVTTLLVFDGARGALVEVGDAPKTGWVTFWEGKKADATSLFRRCSAVDRRRIVLAACAVAESSLKYLPAGEDRPRVAIETARRWARGEATLKEVRDASDAAYAARAAARAAADADDAAAARSSASAAAARAADAAYDDAADVTDSAAVSVDDAAYAAYLAADDSYADAAYYYSGAAKVVRRYIPLSVLACSLVGARDPLPLPRENPKRRHGR